MGSTIVYFALFLVLFREGMSPYIFVSGLLMVLLFFLTLLVNNLYLAFALIIIAFFLLWFATRKWKMVALGAGILILISALLYMLDYYVLKSLGNELVYLFPCSFQVLFMHFIFTIRRQYLHWLSIFSWPVVLFL